MNETSKSNTNEAPDWRHDLKMLILNVEVEWQTAQEHLKDERWVDAHFHLTKMINRADEIRGFLCVKECWLRLPNE